MSEIPRSSKFLEEKYFACAGKKDIGRIWKRLDLLTSRPHPLAPQWTQADLHYYGSPGPNGVTWAVTRGGAEGEIANVRVNHARSFVKAKISLVTASQVAWSVRAKQDSTAAAYATSLSRSLLEDVWNNQGLAAMDVRWEELAQVYGDGHSFTEWDLTRGPDLAVDPAQNLRRKAGDARTTWLPPWLVVTDINRDAAEDQDWWFIRLDRPKPDLVMLYPELADGRKGPEAEKAIYGVRDERRIRGLFDLDVQDLVGVVHFVHRPTIALPLGRHVIMLNGDVVLRDTPLIGEDGDYEMVPIVRRASDERVDSPFSHTSFWDVLGAQEILDAYYSTQATSITTYGNPVLAIEDGSTNNPANIAVFGRPWKYPLGGKPPQFIQAPSLDESHAKFAESLISAEQSMLSLNDAALGQSKGADKNAQADALAASMAVQQAGPAVLARRRSLSQLGQVILTTLRHNVSGNDKRIAHMAGEGQANLIADTKYWTGEDLGPLDSVEVEETSPMEATPQGREAILQSLIESGLKLTPEQMAEVRATGRLNRVVDPQRDEGLLIDAEYEMLCRGQAPVVHPTQDQPAHYKANASVLFSLTALTKPNVLKAVQDTLDKRYFFYFGVWPNGAPPPPGTPPGAPPMSPPDPLKLDRQRFLMGQGPLPMPLPPPGVPPGAGGPPGPGPGAPPPGGPPPGPGQPAPAPDASSPPVNGPINKLTGAPFSPTTPPVQ